MSGKLGSTVLAMKNILKIILFTALVWSAHVYAFEVDCQLIGRSPRDDRSTINFVNGIDTLSGGSVRLQLRNYAFRCVNSLSVDVPVVLFALSEASSTRGSRVGIQVNSSDASGLVSTPVTINDNNPPGSFPFATFVLPAGTSRVVRVETSTTYDYDRTSERRGGYHPIHLGLRYAGSDSGMRETLFADYSVYLNFENPTCKFDLSRLVSRGNVLVADANNSPVDLPDIVLSYQCNLAGSLTFITRDANSSPARRRFRAYIGSSNAEHVEADLTAATPRGDIALFNHSEFALTFPPLLPDGSITFKAKLLPNEKTKFGDFSLRVNISILYP